MVGEAELSRDGAGAGVAGGHPRVEGANEGGVAAVRGGGAGVGVPPSQRASGEEVDSDGEAGGEAGGKEVRVGPRDLVCVFVPPILPPRLVDDATPRAHFRRVHVLPASPAFPGEHTASASQNEGGAKERVVRHVVQVHFTVQEGGEPYETPPGRTPPPFSSSSLSS